MAEEFVPEGETPEDTEQGQDTETLLKTVKKLRAEVKAERAKLEEVRREADTFVELKSRFPDLEREDLEGLPLEKWESRVQRLNQLRSGATTAEKAATEPSEPVTRPEEATFAKAAQIPAGTAGTAGQPVAWNELRKLPMTQQMDLIREGLALDIDGQPIKA